ncbi:MAG: hypothetical protein A2Y40_00620 [Candidatus Margulisbacteria bacterium GWF2_35_9]|nr:MAG: hypothetical protein A2Y40_00620 [Candidatus Margulisbacteria bacterium GWF2_35_9]
MIRPFVSDSSPFILNDPKMNKWPIPSQPEVINARADILLYEHISLLKNKKVLEIGCCNGPFSYITHILGASIIHGIDSETRHIENARHNFDMSNINSNAFEFFIADAIDFLNKTPDHFYDTIICLDSMQNYPDHYQLIQLFHKKAKEAVILDTFTANYTLLLGKKSRTTLKNIHNETFKLPVTYYIEEHNKQLAFSSSELLELIFQSVGFSFDLVNWEKHSQNPRKNWKDLMSMQGKRECHWTDIYSSNICVSYILKNNGQKNV